MVRYRETADRFAFAQTAATAAIAGDIRAQYVLSQVLLECDIEVALTVAQGKQDLAANIEARVSAFPGAQEQDRLCAELATCSAGPALADVLQRDWGANAYARAYAAGQDIAYKVTRSDWEGLQQYLEMRL
jgi:hypothetical protein